MISMMAAFGGHLFHEIVCTGLGGGPWPPQHPLRIRYWEIDTSTVEFSRNGLLSGFSIVLGASTYSS